MSAGFAVALAACFLAAPVPFESKEAGFSIELPGTPQEVASDWQTAWGRQEKRVFTLDGGSSFYTVLYISVPEGMPVPSDEATLQGARDEGLKTSGATLVDEEPFLFQGHPAKRVRARKGTSILENRLYFINRRALYSVTVAYREQEIHSRESIDAFFSSFHLLPLRARDGDADVGRKER